MPSVTHDLFIGHAIAVGSRHEPCSQPVWAERFRQCAFQSSLSSSLEKNLAHCVGGQSGALDHATTVDLAEQRAGGDFGQLKPGLEGGDGTSIVCVATGNGDLGTFALCVRLRAFYDQPQSTLGPSYVFQIHPDKLRTAQCPGETEEKHRLVAGASKIRSAGSAQLADLDRGDGCCSPRRTAMLTSDATERL